MLAILKTSIQPAKLYDSNQEMELTKGRRSGWEGGERLGRQTRRRGGEIVRGNCDVTGKKLLIEKNSIKKINL